MEFTTSWIYFYSKHNFIAFAICGKYVSFAEVMRVSSAVFNFIFK